MSDEKQGRSLAVIAVLIAVAACVGVYFYAFHGERKFLFKPLETTSTREIRECCVDQDVKAIVAEVVTKNELPVKISDIDVSAAEPGVEWNADIYEVGTQGWGVTLIQGTGQIEVKIWKYK